jgi:hypothetical protein
VKIVANQSAAVSVSFKTEHGLPAKIDGTVAWKSSDDAIALVQADTADSTKATVTAGPKAGNAEIVATADADLGDGVEEVEAFLDVEVIARGQAVGGEITPLGASNAPPAEGRPGWGLPDHPEGGQPPSQWPKPDNSLPQAPPPHVSTGLPPSPGKPDQSLPPSAGHPEQGLPPAPAKPGTPLPPHAEPKK